MITRELIQEINKYFKDRGFNWLSIDAVASSSGDGTLVSEIHNGDWKHDHIAIDALVDEFFENHPTLMIACSWKEGYQGSDGDYYTATHLWKIIEKSSKDAPMDLTLLNPVNEGYTNEDRRIVHDRLLNDIEFVCNVLERGGYEVPENIMADDWKYYVLGVKYGVDEIIESTEILIEILQKFDERKFRKEIKMLTADMNKWLKIHGYEDSIDENLSEGDAGTVEHWTRVEPLTEGILLEAKVDKNLKKAQDIDNEAKKVVSNITYYYYDLKGDYNKKPWKTTKNPADAQENVGRYVNAIVTTEDGLYVRTGLKQILSKKRTQYVYRSNTNIDSYGVYVDVEETSAKAPSNGNSESTTAIPGVKMDENGYPKDMPKTVKFTLDGDVRTFDQIMQELEGNSAKVRKQAIVAYSANGKKKLAEGDVVWGWINAYIMEKRGMVGKGIEDRQKRNDAAKAKETQRQDDTAAKTQQRKDKAEAKRVRKSIASTKGLPPPKGNVKKFKFHKNIGDGNHVPAPDMTLDEYKKLTDDQRAGYIIEDEKEHFYGYVALMAYPKVWAALTEDLELDDDTISLMESYAMSKSDMRYDDDFTDNFVTSSYTDDTRVDDDFK